MIPIQKNWRLTLASAAAVAMLAACGGGGDASSSAASANAPLAAQQVTPVPMAAARSNEVSATAAPEATQSAPIEAATPASTTTSVYLVQMADLPAAAYDGRIDGYASTKITSGQKLNPDSPDVSSYVNRLAAKHDAAISSVGASKKLYSYRYSYNGFAAVLTQEQATKMASSKEVVAVTKDEVRALDTATTPAFLGLSGNGGFWAATGKKGEDVIIGMVDSGIWPESLSFSDRVDANGAPSRLGVVNYGYAPERWHGRCDRGDGVDAFRCNRKVIGGRFYNAGWAKAGYPLSLAEYNSPRDAEGHGTHTASTAGGNSGVALTGPLAGLGFASGMAPRARIAAYKVCWTPRAPVTGGCFTSDSVAAIDQAVADGVDVINFSISGATLSSNDPVEMAFMFAANAGVFVAASAGNSGPAVSTVAHPSPWLTTVAAGTHNRGATGSVTTGDNVTRPGASLATAVSSKPFIDSVAAGLANANVTAMTKCYSSVYTDGSWPTAKASLDPAKVAGKIVLCERGTNARTDKSLAVKEAGGAGMVLVNVSANTIDADIHYVPTVHLPIGYRVALHAYAATTGATASIAAAVVNTNTPAPFTANFSSRGPSLAANSGNMLKPDIIAPGVDIVAAVSPPGNNGRQFDSYQGTSMSSPHIAGIAALFKQAHPDWSPMAIKSALMTTAGDVLDGPNTSPGVIFAQGAGHVRPSAALNPGLVFDSNLKDWYGFLCGTDVPTNVCTVASKNATGQVVPVIAPQNMNVASIALAQLGYTQTVTRRVTNVGGSAANYTASNTGLTGLTVTMNPSTLSINAGETKTVTFTITNVSAPLNTYVGGQLTLADGAGHLVRIPVVVKPVGLQAPLEVSGSYGITFGYAGSFAATADGLIPATLTNGTVQQDGSSFIQPTLPAGWTIARFQTFDGGALVAGTDIDLELYCGNTRIAVSGGDTAAEVMTVRRSSCPSAVLTVRVIGYTIPNATANFTLYSWILAGTSAGNMGLLGPTTASQGGSGNITLVPVGLTAATKYMGAVHYNTAGIADGSPATIVRIDTP